MQKQKGTTPVRHKGRLIFLPPLLLIFFICILLSARIHANPATSQFTAAADLGIPVFDTETGTLAATIRVGRIQRDYQRKGFFRIGLLPLIVAQDVSIHIKDERQIQRNLANFENRLRSSTQALPFEIRHLQITIQDPRIPLLAADLARLQADRSWYLFTVKLRVGEETMKFPRAQLVLTTSGVELRTFDRSVSKVFKLFPTSRSQHSTNHNP